MPNGLGKHKIIGFVPVVDAARAKEFYRQTLGLELVSEELPYAIVFNANGNMLRLVLGATRPSVMGTVLGWQVPNASEAVKDLRAAGVEFERYEFLPQDEEGIWTTPTGSKVAWFQDPDGNVLSISEHPEWTR